MHEGRNIIDKVYKTWLNEDSPCSECPVYDRRGCRTPFYGHGTFNEADEVDVMLIAEAPGPASQEDTPGNEGHQRSLKEFIRERRRSRIYDAFGDNSPNLKYFTDTLQSEFDAVYFTNLLKCNKLEEQDGDNSGSWIDTDRLTDSHNYEYKTDRGLQFEGNLNQKAKQKCSAHLELEIATLNPSVTVCMGKSNISKLYQIFNMDLPDIPTYLENGREHSVDLNTNRSDTKISTTVIPSYHFTRPRFESNINNCSFVDSNADAPTRRKTYWDRVVEIVKSAHS